MAATLFQGLICHSDYCDENFASVTKATDQACGIARNELCDPDSCPENYYNKHCIALRRDEK